jgi:hypothetical protein
MTIKGTRNGAEYEYSGVLAKAPDSPGYRLIAPDNTTVDTYQYKPKQVELESRLRDAGYTVPSGSKIPFRNMTTRDENLPGDLSL